MRLSDKGEHEKNQAHSLQATHRDHGALRSVQTPDEVAVERAVSL